MLDAVVVGSGPNGLAAAITLAEAGKRVRVIEGHADIGGGTRTAELTEPGVRHDICSSVHPLGVGSPYFGSLPLDERGLEWAHPRFPFAHALDSDESAVVHRSLDFTAAEFGGDGTAWRTVFGPFVDDWDRTARLATGPPLRAVRHPLAGLRLARHALRSGAHLADRFETPKARAVIAGLAAHSLAPLDRWATGGVALLLGAAAHAVGWPFAAGGSASIAAALSAHLEDLGGEIETGRWVRHMSDLPNARVVLLDTSAQAAAGIAGEQMSRFQRRRYRRRPVGPGSFKLDIVTDGPIPWADDRLGGAGTVHLGGTFEEIAAAEEMTWHGDHPDRPFVLLAQPMVADPSRAPEDTGVVWAYCHVPTGSTADMTEQIIGQIERFAPGFAGTIRSMSMRNPRDLEDDNPNYPGGDITGGPISLWGVLSRPTVFRPYRAGGGVYLCSSATPPGAGVHGMCGHQAALAALRELD